jgi:ubiquinone/menaquinone biosynthesis C-methylase UbiE
MQDSAKPGNQYALGHSQQELERLGTQGRMFEPFTRQLFQEAGLEAGMRVLDVGSGSGDVSFLAASLVGPAGTVIGVDRAEEAVGTARARAQRLGVANVEFRVGDAAEMSFEHSFDAVVGRLVLMYCPQPVDALRKFGRQVRQGGIMAFQEFDFEGARSYPTSGIVEQCVQWMITVFQRMGNATRMGMKLRSAFLDAGLPAPSMRLDATIGGGEGHIMYLVIAEVIRSLQPLIERFGIATAAEIGIESLRDRMEAEVVQGRGVIVSPSLIGAWTRLGS